MEVSGGRRNIVKEQGRPKVEYLAGGLSASWQEHKQRTTMIRYHFLVLAVKHVFLVDIWSEPTNVSGFIEQFILLGKNVYTISYI